MLPTGLGEINTHLNQGGLTGVYEGGNNSSHGYTFEQAVAPPEFNLLEQFIGFCVAQFDLL